MGDIARNTKKKQRNEKRRAIDFMINMLEISRRRLFIKAKHGWQLDGEH